MRSNCETKLTETKPTIDQPVVEKSKPYFMLPSSVLFQLRKNDYRRIKQKEVKTLTKWALFFEPDKKAECFGGKSKTMPYKDIKSETGKLFYLSDHPTREYFANEVLLLLGINTPKTRLISNGKIATKCIHGFIPMFGIRHEKELTESDVDDKASFQVIKNIRARYKLDPVKQTIYDNMERQEYKVTGPLFVANIAAALIDDADFQPHYFNLGVVRVQNRFYVTAIDKEKAGFKGLSFSDLQERTRQVQHDELFKSGTPDQKLHVVHSVQESLIPEKGYCAFDKIFENARVNRTLELETKEVRAAYCKNLKYSATSLVKFFKKSCDYNAFLEKEATRKNIANKVLEKFNFKHSDVSDYLQIIIMSDLRAPYYSHLKDEAALINAVYEDLCTEFNVIVDSSKVSQTIKSKFL